MMKDLYHFVYEEIAKLVASYFKDGAESAGTEKERRTELIENIIFEIQKSLSLSFVSEIEEGNVCMANNEEVRADFRTTFTPLDLLDYIFSVLHSSEKFSKAGRFLEERFFELSAPTSTAEFWNLVESGAGLRKLYLSEAK